MVAIHLIERIVRIVLVDGIERIIRLVLVDRVEDVVALLVALVEARLGVTRRCRHDEHDHGQ